MPFVVDKATPADIPALTSILLADDPPSPFTQLMLGAVDARAINMRLAARTAKGIDDPTEMWLVARDEQTKKTASFAQWQLPRDEADDDDDDDDLSEADLDAERQVYRKALTPGMNVDLCVRFNDEIKHLRNTILQGRKHYLLMNLATSPAWQHRGAATALITHPFPSADRYGTIVYLDTALDGPGLSLYTRLGFREMGECRIDLDEYGGQGTHVHVGMIRWPTSPKSGSDDDSDDV